MLQKRRVAGKLIHVLMVATCDETIQCWVRHCMPFAAYQTKRIDQAK